jgi:hypothetical protein
MTATFIVAFPGVGLTVGPATTSTTMDEARAPVRSLRRPFVRLTRAIVPSVRRFVPRMRRRGRYRRDPRRGVAAAAAKQTSDGRLLVLVVSCSLSSRAWQTTVLCTYVGREGQLRNQLHGGRIGRPLYWEALLKDRPARLVYNVSESPSLCMRACVRRVWSVCCSLLPTSPSCNACVAAAATAEAAEAAAAAAATEMTSTESVRVHWPWTVSRLWRRGVIQ